MTKPSEKRSTGCPIAFALDAFGDRWSLLVVRDLMLAGKRTYGEFRDADEGIATNILADRLKQLEANGILRKARDPDSGRRFLYSLTERGRDLAPVILELVRWSGKYDPNSIAPRDILDRIATDREGLLADMMARLSNEDGGGPSPGDNGCPEMPHPTDAG